MSHEVLMLVPGLVCDASVWQSQVQALVNPGLGHETLDEAVADILVIEHGLQDSLADMASAALAKAPPTFALAGHSMGGRVAFEIFRQAPERVTRLALLDTGAARLPAGKAGDNERLGRMQLLKLAREQGMRQMARAWARNMVHPDRLRDSVLMESIFDMIGRSSPEQYAAQIKALLARPDAQPLLPRIACPTLLLCGMEDNWSPLDQHRKMAARIDASVLVGIPGCGHMSTLERPRAVSDALRAWLLDEPQIHRVAMQAGRT